MGIRRTPACRGLLRFTIEEQCGTNKIDVVREHIDQMGFQDWDNLLEDKGLAQRLANLGIEDTQTTLEHARQALIERQALFTMAAR